MHKKRWIFIADGSRGKVLEKYRGELHLVNLTCHAEEVAAPYDKGHHQPGSVRSSFGGLAQESLPPHGEFGHPKTAHAFIKDMCKMINNNHLKFDELLLVAPPKVIGDMRQFLSKESQHKIVREIHKDYTHTPMAEIEPLL